jgi:hypothetical protein
MLLALNGGKDGREELSKVPMRKICPESAKMKGLTPLFFMEEEIVFYE